MDYSDEHPLSRAGGAMPFPTKSKVDRGRRGGRENHTWGAWKNLARGDPQKQRGKTCLELPSPIKQRVIHMESH